MIEQYPAASIAQNYMYNDVYKIEVNMSDYIRTQILLEKNLRIQLDKVAEEKGVPFSELVRDFLNAQLRVHAYEQMRRAAQQLYNDYANDKDLTDLTTLDGEDFAHDER